MRDGKTTCSARFAVSIVGKKQNDEQRLRHCLTIVDTVDARFPEDAVKHAVREFVKANPGYGIAGSLCEAIRHG